MPPEVHRKNPCDIVKNFAVVMCDFIKRLTVILLSKCKMTGLFSSCIRISLLYVVLSGDKRSCMLPVNMSWAHCISWCGTEV